MNRQFNSRSHSNTLFRASSTVLLLGRSGAGFRNRKHPSDVARAPPSLQK